VRSRRGRALACITLLTLMATIVPVTPGAAGTAERRLPPSGRDDLAEIFDPLLAPMGLVTTRAALQRTDTYERDPEGRHLAVYVEPTGAYTDAQFIEGFMDVTRVYLPKVFKRWKGLRSFDVCQEPVPGVDDRLAPPPVTQILVNRRTSRGIDWAEATLADMIALAKAHEQDTGAFNLFIDERLKDQPAYVSAQAEADAAGTAGTASSTGVYR
jgi:hypothetical protein